MDKTIQDDNFQWRQLSSETIVEGVIYEADMENDQIFPRTRFVNNQNFRKKYISKFLTITRIIVEVTIYRL